MAWTLTACAPCIPRNVIVPLIGSTSVGAPPQFVTSVPAEFHDSPVFSTGPAATRSSLELVAIGLGSMELRRMLQKLLLTWAARLLTDFPCAFTKPISAWLRGVSTVTSPVCIGDVYQTNCRVSDTIGLGVAITSNGCVGGPVKLKLVTKLVTDRTFTCNHVQTRERSVCHQLLYVIDSWRSPLEGKVLKVPDPLGRLLSDAQILTDRRRPRPVARALVST
jgi:hypothetical protein